MAAGSTATSPSTARRPTASSTSRPTAKSPSARSPTACGRMEGPELLRLRPRHLHPAARLARRETLHRRRLHRLPAGRLPGNAPHASKTSKSSPATATPRWRRPPTACSSIGNLGGDDAYSIHPELSVGYRNILNWDFDARAAMRFAGGPTGSTFTLDPGRRAGRRDRRRPRPQRSTASSSTSSSATTPRFRTRPPRTTARSRCAWPSGRRVETPSPAASGRAGSFRADETARERLGLCRLPRSQRLARADPQARSHARRAARRRSRRLLGAHPHRNARLRLQQGSTPRVGPRHRGTRTARSTCWPCPAAAPAAPMARASSSASPMPARARASRSSPASRPAP